jgi:hypothetical protein
MELSESGIVEFFDGTYIDLGRIIEITPVRSPTETIGACACASFSILYMFQEKRRDFRYEDTDFLSADERQAIFRKHYDMAQAYGGKNGMQMSQAELREKLIEALGKHHSALIEAWKAFKLGNPSRSLPKVAG